MEGTDQRLGRGFNASEKTELWDRWQRGESLKAIGRAFGKPSSSIYFQRSESSPLKLRHSTTTVICIFGRIPHVTGNVSSLLNSRKQLIGG